MTKIYLYTRWTVWFHHWLLIENSSKQKPQTAAFNFYFFLTIQWLLTSKQLCPQLHMHNSHSWHGEPCASIWVLKLCQNMKKTTMQRKKYAFWVGQGIFIYLLNNRVFAVQVWMFSSLFLCLLIFFLYGCSEKQIRRAGQTYTKSFNISILVSSLKLQSTELMDFVILI